jgi:hypothetical protein
LEASPVKQFAAVLSLVTVVSVLPARGSAQAIGRAAEEGWSPEGFLLSFGVGAYRPDPGDEDWDVRYPDDNGPILLLEFDFYLYRIPFIGPIGLGVAGGWSGYKGTLPPSTQTLKFNLFPLNLMAVLRIDALARETPVPFVFTGKVGFNSVFFNEDAGSGKSTGRTHGFGWAAQFAIELNFVNRRRANALDEDWGINSSFFFFELAGSDANSRALFGDNLYFTGGIGLTF